MNWELRLLFPVVTSGRESHVSIKKGPLRHLLASMGVSTAALAPIHILAAPGDLFEADFGSGTIFKFTPGSLVEVLRSVTLLSEAMSRLTLSSPMLNQPPNSNAWSRRDHSCVCLGFLSYRYPF